MTDKIRDNLLAAAQQAHALLRNLTADHRGVTAVTNQLRDAIAAELAVRQAEGK